jgi:hypothetical protein
MSHNVHRHSPGAQPTLDVLSIGVGALRAPGFSLDARLAAMVARLERRPFFWWNGPSPRYQRLRAAQLAALHALPMIRVRRMGSSLRMEFERDHEYHDRMLEALGYSREAM